MQRFFVVFIIFFQSLAWSGVSSVGKGGGFAELQLIQYFKNVNIIVEFCLSHTVDCHLNSSQVAAWSNLQHSSSQLSTRYAIEYVSEGFADWEVHGDLLKVNSKALYKEDQALPEYQLLAFAISIQLTLIDANSLSFQQRYSETLQNLENLRFFKQTSSVQVRNYPIAFHRISLKLGAKNLMIFALEDHQRSTLLNALISEAQSRVVIEQLSFNQIEMYVSQNQVFIYGLASGIHLDVGAFQNRRFQIVANLDLNEAISPADVTFSILLK